MQIDINTNNFHLTDALRGHVEQRLLFALTYFDEHIQRIVMWLADINSPRGKVYKYCHLQVILADLPDVVIEEFETDLHVAIDLAANRAGRTVRHRLTGTGRPRLGNQNQSDRYGTDRQLTGK